MPPTLVRLKAMKDLLQIASHPYRKSPSTSRNRSLSKPKSNLLITTLCAARALSLFGVLNEQEELEITLILMKTRRIRSSFTNTQEELLSTYTSVWLNTAEIVNRMRYYQSLFPARQPRFQHVLFCRLMGGPEKTFLKIACMSKNNYMVLVNKIRAFDVFTNLSHCPQAPVEIQLLVALANLGLSGNGGGIGVIAHLFDIGEGSFENYTMRCVAAILRLQNKFVKWPSPEERRAYQMKYNTKSPFKGCVGYVDGKLIALAFGPPKFKED